MALMIILPVLQKLDNKGLTFQRLVRYKSKSNKSKNHSHRYAESLNLPKTLMPLTMKGGAALQREKEIQMTDEFKNLYEWQKEQNWDKTFVLHDGPPYANGKTHVGHAVNKILKDITNRFKVLTQHRVHYVPGWDCHGMPIEIKAITDKQGHHQNLSALEIRDRAKKFAEDTIKDQKTAFQSWGIMADWDNPYKTLNPGYEVKQLEIFYKIFEKGYMYRDYMPVYWSPSSQTALAEAELEYNPSHVSPSVYIKFPLQSVPQSFGHDIGEGNPVFGVVWTTTPWTLPFNQAICYNPLIRYCLLKDESNGCHYVCEESFVDKLKTITGTDLLIESTFDGSCLEGVKYTNPLNSSVLPFLSGAHVLSGKGTGLVHTAPAHGHDDFAVATQYDLPKECHVDAEGRFSSGVVDELMGKTIGLDAEKAVIRLLGEWVLQVEDFTHSYPYDWRTKKPVIIRASKQWFVNTSKLKAAALEKLSNVRITPQQSEKGMVAEISSRPYWCISRQRTWGVPIPVFYHLQSGEPLITKETVDHLCRLIGVQGSDCWWKLPVSDLLPDDLLLKIGKGKSSDYVKGGDILDIWFDSGVSWAAVLDEFGGQADVCLEGVDQYKGWFQTSLLTSVAARGTSPYKTIITHGFATDETGRKMSKSVGNVVHPDSVIQGGKDKRQYPSYGVDVLRWWVAHSHHHQQIKIGPSILAQLNEDVFKIRKCIRHLVGCLHDFDPQSHLVDYSHMTLVDQYILHILYTMMEQILEAYENANYHRVVQHIEKFVYADLSSFYMTNTKDRIYCDHESSVGRRACQSAMFHITKSLCAAMAPIMPHIAQEVHSHTPLTNDSVFHQGLYKMQSQWKSPAILDTLLPVFDIRQGLTERIDNPIKFDLTLHSATPLHLLLKTIQAEETSSSSPLCEIFQTSCVTLLDESQDYTLPQDAIVIKDTALVIRDDTLGSSQVEYTLAATPASLHICERCRCYTSESSNTPCQRCLDVLATDWSV